MRITCVAFAMVWAAAACTSGPPPPESDVPYEAELEGARAAKDRMFRLGDQSPLLPEDKATFAGLPYYPIDASYRVPASLELDAAGGGAVILLPTSKDQMRRMRRVGTLRFRLRGEPLALTAFADAEARTVDSLFVPFGDLTNRTETYGGGRYLDLDRTSTGLYDLDFNRAYHPYCVFNIDYECPVPPPENRLPVEIPAGARLPPG
jgi:hypothetical protein